jgi:hypothetical protein
MKKVIVLMSVAFLASNTCVFGLVVKDSALFTTSSYEASTDRPEVEAAPWWTFPTPYGDINAATQSAGTLHAYSDVSGYGPSAWYGQQPFGGYAQGFTIETSIQIIGAQNPANRRNFTIGGVAVGGYGTLIIGATDARVEQTGTGYHELGASVNNDAQHIWRMANYLNPITGGPVMQVWRDGVDMGTHDVSWVNNTSSYSTWMGDLSGSCAGEWDLDYIRVDFTGAYAPVPEPATISLLALGGLALLRKRK